MSTRGESMSRRTSIHIKACFTTEPERHVGANGSAHGTLPLVGFCVTAMSPVVIAMDMTTAEVRPRLLLLYHIFTVDAGERQCVQPDGTLRPGSVDLLSQSLNVFLSWSVKQSVCCSPQKGGSTQVDQGAILEDVGLIFYLEVEHRDDGQISDTTFTES